VIDVVAGTSESPDIMVAPENAVLQAYRDVISQTRQLMQGATRQDWSIDAWINDINLGRLGIGTLYLL
jgi:hypothetical protein